MSEEGTTHRHHSIDYVEITVLDLEAAKGFYAGAFGWTFNDYGPGYAGIQDPAAEGREVGGLCVGEDVRTGGPLVILFSDDLDSTVNDVTAAGGAIISAPYEFPGGRRLNFADPSGNELAVWATR